MTKPLLAILLLLPLSVSAGELDGRAIVCQGQAGRLPGWDSPTGWEFRDGKAYMSYIQFDDGGTKATLVTKDHDGYVYEVNVSSVRWNVGPADSMWGHLDRKTLKYQYLNSETGDVYWSIPCTVADSLSEYRATMEEARLKQQSEIDDEMKSNKI